jgi:hypothetical protein
LRIAFVITPRDHYRAIRGLTALMPASRWSYAFFLGVPALCVVVIFGLGLGAHVLRENWGGLVAGPFFIFVFMPLLVYWQVRSSHRTNAALAGEQVYEFSESGMVASGPLHTTSLTWAAFHRAVETERFFFLFVSNRMAYFLPRGAVASQVGMDAFRALLEKHLPGKAKLRREPVPAAA